jgi:flagellar motor switch/type III secretory pathway protein FliN
MSSSPTSSSSTDAPAKPFAGLLDVLCTVDVIVGTGAISVRDCLKLKPNSVIRLVQSAGADLQLSVNGIATATGEIVVDDESTALRISQVLTTPDAEADS